MPKSQGQTDQVLKLKLPSSIVRTGWGLDAVAQGGKIPLEVWTHWVADGSEIQITIKDLEGSAVETVKGKVYSDLFRVPYAVSKPNKTGGMYFEAELSAHSLKAVGPKVRVWPGAKISGVRLLDAQGKALKDVEEAQTYTVEAKVHGAPNGAVCRFEILVENKNHARTRLTCLETKVDNGKASAQWQGTYRGDEMNFEGKVSLAKNAEDYAVPNFLVHADCLGAAGESDPIPYASWVEFNFGQRGKADLILPDGTKKTEDVPDTGLLRVDKPKAGRVRLAGFTPTDENGKPLGPQVLPGDEDDNGDDSNSDDKADHSEQKSKFDAEAAASKLRENAKDRSTGWCARYVRDAIQAGGIDITPHPAEAKDYGPYLVQNGFAEFSSTDDPNAKVGDVVVIQPYEQGSASGHIAMYDGSTWISDFVQNDFWGGAGYRNNKSKHAFYRWK